MSAIVDRATGRPPTGVTKILPRSSGRTRNGSSSCTTMLYWLPVHGPGLLLPKAENHERHDDADKREEDQRDTVATDEGHQRPSA
jgi:hypothetical protein